jgi:alanyl-tRNA synthetase
MVLATRVEGADAGALRSAVDQLKSRLGSAIVVLGSVESDSKVVLVAGVTPDQTGRVKAGELIGRSRPKSAAKAAAVRTLPRRAAASRRRSTPRWPA